MVMCSLIDREKVAKASYPIVYSALEDLYKYGFYDTLLSELNRSPVSSYIIINNCQHIESKIKHNSEFINAGLKYLNVLFDELAKLSQRELNSRVIEFNKKYGDVIKFSHISNMLKSYKQQYVGMGSIFKILDNISEYDELFFCFQLQGIDKKIKSNAVINNFLNKKPTKIDYKILPGIFYSKTVVYSQETISKILAYKEEFKLDECFINEILKVCSKHKNEDCIVNIDGFYPIIKKYYDTNKNVIIQDLIKYINIVKLYLDFNFVTEAKNIIENNIKPFYCLQNIDWIQANIISMFLDVQALSHNLHQNLNDIINNENIDIDTSKNIIQNFDIHYYIHYCSKKELWPFLFFGREERLLYDKPEWLVDFFYEYSDEITSKCTCEQLIKINSIIQIETLEYEAYKTDLINNFYNNFIKQKVKSVIFETVKTITQIKDKLYTATNEEIIQSLCYVNEFIKNYNIKNRETAIFNKFINLVEVSEIMDAYKKFNTLEVINNKFKQKIFILQYEKEIQDIEVQIEKIYSKKIEELKNNLKFNLEKYINIFKGHLNSRYNELHAYCNEANFWKTFTSIVNTYGREEILIGFASNEYYYQQLNLYTEGAELTPLLVCLIKTIEQLFCCCINYSINNNLSNSHYISTSKGTFHIKNDIIRNNNNWEKTKATCFGLKEYIVNHVIYNDTNIISSFVSKKEMTELLDKWVKFVRNSHLHKDNLYNINDVEKHIETSYKVIKYIISLFHVIKPII